jgi:dihydrofolate synthase/folylpolyglutamate synthase
VAVLGVLNDKDWREMMQVVAAVAERIVLVSPPSAPPQRAWDPAEALAFAQANGIDAAVEPDFERAVTKVPEGVGTVLITGSFHTVGDALKLFGEKTV